MCALDARGPQGREGVEDRGNINMGLQSGNTVKPKTTKPPSETRKIRKPLMERKRRERINTSLNDLAVLLTEANLVKGETGKASKLEKADILELTVKHLKELKETRSQGDTCSASTSTGVGKDRTEAAASGKTYNSGDDTSSDNANNKHTEQSEDKQNRNHIVKETTSDGKHDKITCAACSLPLKNSGNSSNVCEIINSQEQKSSCSTEEQRTNPSSAGPSSSKGSAKNENYALGFKKCMSAIESVMKVKQDNENYHQANIRPKLLNHLKNFLKSIDIDLKTSVTSSQVCIDTLSLDDSDSSSTGTDVSSTTSETNSNISPLPSLTLVPTRLPGGNLAFVVQEGAGATALLQSAEIMLQKPETKEEKSAHKRPTEGKSIIKSEDSLLSDDIKTRKKEDSHPIKVESSNYTTQTHTKESLEQSPSQLQSPLQPVFKQTVVSNTNLTVQPSPISTAAMTPDRPSKVSQKITENSPENERQDNYNLPLTPQTPTVRPPTVNTVSSPLITPSTPREHFIVKRAICASRATTAVAPLRPVDTNISQLPKTSLLPNENLTLPSTSTFDTRTIFTPVKESTSFDFYHPVTPKTPNSENGSQQIQSSSLTSHSSMSYPSSFALSTPTASTSFHAIYTDQTQFLTPPPTPIGYESLRKTSVNLYQECESSFVCNPSPLQHSSTSTSQLTLRSPSDSHLNLQNDRAKTTEEKNERDRPQERRDGVENPFMGEERRNHQDNDLPFDLSLRRMWRPW